MNQITRKFRKLRREPSKFFKDFFANRKRQVNTLFKIHTPASKRGSITAKRRYSVVAAVYGVEAYLDEFFESFVKQSLDFESAIELVMVDDGSPDGSAEIVKKWQRRYPNNIKYIYKENGGQGSARNLGIEYATGNWITFVDPDDFVAADYFEQVERCIAKEEHPPSIVSCKLVLYFERGKRRSDSHPLTFRFAKASQAVDLKTSETHIQLSVNSAFFDARIVRKHHVRFDERIRPNFEDAHFANCYLSHVLDRRAIFLGNAKYFYRKRENESSTLDTAWQKPGLFGAVLEHGVLDMLRRYANLYGKPPPFVQRTALYHIIWYVLRLVNNPGALAFLPEDERERFVSLLRESFEFVERRTIDTFSLAGVWFFHRVGLLGMFKDADPINQIVYVEDVDFQQNLFQLRYFTREVGFEAFLFDGVEVSPVFSTSRIHTFLNRKFVEERLVWLPLHDHAQLTVALPAARTRLSISGSGKQHDDLSIAGIRRHFELVKQRRHSSEWTARLLKWAARLPAVRRCYAGAWLLMDRDVQADDNAEHLYRYLLQKQPHVNSWFALKRRSHDWRRLKREGFRLVPFGSLRHKLLLLNCDHLVTSHADGYIVDMLPRAHYADQLRYRLTFLQHGVTHNDMSRWLNTKKFDRLITTATAEYRAIADAGTRYKFSSREVALTGFPRHDRLVGSNPPQKVILVMPTWRLSLVGPAIPGSARRALNPEFAESRYFEEWNGLLQEGALASLAKRYGYRIVFFPHANIQPYLHLFRLPGNVELATHAQGGIQDIFSASALMITDYSSASFDFGILQRPIVYFQFDREEFAQGAHTSEKGYFDYFSDGFGPVCDERHEVLRVVEQALQDGGRIDDFYQQRISEFFAFQDGKNCERTFQAIDAIDLPASPPKKSVRQTLSRLEAAHAAKAWSFVTSRCAELLELPDATEEERVRAAVLAASGHRAMGKAASARQSLEAVGADAARSLEVAIEYAEIASLQADWREAGWRWGDVLERVDVGFADVGYVARRLLSALLSDGRQREAVAVAHRLASMPQEAVRAKGNFARLAGFAATRGDYSSARRFAGITLANADEITAKVPEGVVFATLALARVHAAGDDVIKSCSLLMGLLRKDANNKTVASVLDSLLDKRHAWRAVEARERMAGSMAFQDPLDDDVAKCSSSDALDVALCLAGVHRQSGEFGVAQELVDSLLASHATDPFVKMEAGELALARERWTEAEAHFTTACEAKWAAHVSRVGRGLLLARHRLGMLDKCVALAESIFAVRRGDLPVALAYAELASRRKRWAEAETGWLAVFSDVTGEPQTRLHAGRMRCQALRELGRVEDARELFELLMGDHARDVGLLRDYAEFHSACQKWRPAAELWRLVGKSVMTLPERRQAARMEAAARWWEGDLIAARALFDREMEASAYDALTAGDLENAARLAGIVRTAARSTTAKSR
jgi:glycosyltransferase involved in cell wall biosynthesis/CDP-glycerol glycerophosphotransferase (TagB/SpsB family)